MEGDQQKGYRVEKGTKYPDRPYDKIREYPAEGGVEERFSPEAPKAPQTPPPPNAPPIPTASGVATSKVVLFVVGGFLVLGIAMGIFIYTKIKNSPFTFDEGKIIVEDSKGDKLEIDRKATLPGDFPLDIPMFPTDLELTASARFLDDNGGTSAGSIFTWETRSLISVVINYYRSALPANGWTVTQITDIGTGGLVIANKDNRGLTFLITEKGDKTEIILTFTGTQGEPN